MASGSDAPLTVCLDAREPLTGGVRQTLLGLAAGLSRLGGEDRYLFLTPPGGADWLRPYLSGGCRLLELSGSEARAPLHWLRQRLPERTLARLADNPLRALLPIRVARSDGTAERAGAEVMHLTRQAGFLTGLPTIYCPHDLQHEHLPELFSTFQLRWRRRTYAALAGRARAVVSLTRTGRAELQERLGVSGERLFTIGWASLLSLYPAPEEMAGLEGPYAFFPAHTFRHKNHLGLFEALALLRQAGLRIPLICCGGTDGFTRVLRSKLRKLGLSEEVRFLGEVGPGALRGLYRGARLTVFPSLFEGFGMPLLESFEAGVPVACSALPVLQEVGGDAVLTFDPRSPPSIAAALRRLWTDEPLRARLARLGRARAGAGSWEGVALRYRALYRWVAGRRLDEADRQLLAGLGGA
jgi:glycosyltransferase involved in cell wall biosynthesis